MKARAAALATAPRNSARCSAIQSLSGEADFQTMKIREASETATTVHRQDPGSSPIRTPHSWGGVPTLHTILDLFQGGLAGRGLASRCTKPGPLFRTRRMPSPLAIGLVAHDDKKAA